MEASLAQAWEAELLGSPALLPLAVDVRSDTVDLVRLSPVDYEKASFLDARVVATTVARPTFEALSAATGAAGPACDFIFHIGHVGSTLLSRLLGTHPAIFSVREPQVLRSLAQVELENAPWRGAAFDRRLDVLLTLLSRTWTPGRRSLIKATSVVGELATRMLRRQPQARALLMAAPPASYLATIFGGANSRTELRVAAPMRLARLHRRLGDQVWRLSDMSEGEIAAMSWAAEIGALAQAAEDHPARCAWIDFDRLLSDRRAGLVQALAALHGTAEPAAVEQIAASAYFDRYSKAPEYAYGPALRAEILAAARVEHAVEIKRGLNWLDAAGRFAPLAAVWRRFGTTA